MIHGRTRTLGTTSVKQSIVKFGKNVYRRRLSNPDRWETRVDPITDIYQHQFNDSQRMVDVYGELGRFNPCSHTKRFPVSVVCRGAASPMAPSGWPTGYNAWQLCQQDKGWQSLSLTPSGLHSSYDLISTPSLTAADWSSLVNQVGSQLDGRMTTGQNLFVDLAQLSQTVGMLKNPFNLKKLPKLLRSKPLGELKRIAASGYLEYQFGWKPVWNDVLALRDAFTEVSKHIGYIRETVNKFVSLSARQSQTISNPSVGTFRSVGSDTSLLMTPVCTAVKRTYCFSLDLRRTEAALHWSYLDQMLNRLGARDLASALWDLVPYSFVVDWFTHVGDIWKLQPIDWPKFDIRRMGYSTKTEWFVRFDYTSKARSDYDSVYTYANGQTESSLAQRVYERVAGFPPASATVGLFGNLNKTQIAEGVALIVQRL